MSDYYGNQRPGQPDYQRRPLDYTPDGQSAVWFWVLVAAGVLALLVFALFSGGGETTVVHPGGAGAPAIAPETGITGTEPIPSVPETAAPGGAATDQ